MATLLRSHSIGRFELALSLGAVVLANYSCGGGGGADGGSVGPGAQFPLTNLELLDAPQVDLPGRVSLFLRALGPLDQGIGGMTAAQFKVRENGVALAPDQVALRELDGVYANLTHLVLDWTDSVVASASLQASVLASAKVFASELFKQSDPHLAISLIHGSELLHLGPAGQPFLGFSNNLQALLNALDFPPSVTPDSDACNLFGGLYNAALAVQDGAAGLIQNQGYLQVDKNLVLFAEGPDNLGEKSQVEAALALAELQCLCVAFGPQTSVDLFEPLDFDGIEHSLESSALSSLMRASGLSLAQRSAAVLRLAFLSGQLHGQPAVAIEVLGSAGGGSATNSSSVDPVGFSPGAGFLDAQRIALKGADLAQGGHRSVVPTPDGKLYLLSEYASDGFVVSRLLASGELDSSFGLEGSLVFDQNPSDPAVTPVDLLLNPSDATLYVCASQAHSSGQVQVKLYHLDANGLIDSLLLPKATTNWNDYARSLVRDAAGRIWVGASAGVSPVLSRRVVVWRLNSALELDLSFGSGGVLIWGPGTASAKHSNKAMVVSGDSGSARLYVAGESALNASSQLDLRVAAFDESGTLDASFGAGGSVYNAGTFHQAPFGAFGSASSMLQDSSGRLVVAGGIQSLSGTKLVPCLWRILPNGTPDESFVGDSQNPFGPGNLYNGRGLVTLPDALTQDPAILFGKDAFAEDLVLGPNQEPLVLGWRIGPNSFLDAIWIRWRNDGVLDASFNGTGYLIDDGALFDNGTEFPRTLSVLPSGNLVSAGFSNLAPLGIGPDSSPLLFIDADPTRAF